MECLGLTKKHRILLAHNAALGALRVSELTIILAEKLRKQPGWHRCRSNGHNNRSWTKLPLQVKEKIEDHLVINSLRWGSCTNFSFEYVQAIRFITASNSVLIYKNSMKTQYTCSFSLQVFDMDWFSTRHKRPPHSWLPWSYRSCSRQSTGGQPWA